MFWKQMVVVSLVIIIGDNINFEYCLGYNTKVFLISNPMFT